MNTADATASGVPYPVLQVGGQPPSTLDQFVGETAFTVVKAGTESEVCGVGTRTEDVVLFHEKLAGLGKDVRVWRLQAHQDATFSAETQAAF
jgi:hypothetical protein